jgi:hypothetical protein
MKGAMRVAMRGAMRGPMCVALAEGRAWQIGPAQRENTHMHPPPTLDARLMQRCNSEI